MGKFEEWLAERDQQVASAAVQSAIEQIQRFYTQYLAQPGTFAQRDQVVAEVTAKAVSDFVTREGACICACSACRGRHGPKIADVRVVSMPDRLRTTRKSVERDGADRVTSVTAVTVEETV